MNSLETILTAIADRLRVLSGTSGNITLSQMPQLIRDHWEYHDLNEEDLIQRTLTSITIPSGVTEIGDHAFFGCTSLTSVTIPNSVTKIRDWSFFGCTSLTSVTIPDSVTRIGSVAFGNCRSLTSIAIPNSVTEMEAGVFQGCFALTDIYCGFAQGAVSGAPWGATNATIHYNS